MRKFIGNKLVGSSYYELSTVEECLEYFKDKEFIEVDTETEGFDPHTCNLLCMQLGDRDIQFVIDTSCVNIQLFKPLLESEDKTFLFQNAKFDLRFFMLQNIHIKNIYDTFLAECLLTSGLEETRDVSLKGIVEKYLGIDLDKSIRGDIRREGLSDRVIVYAADDVRYLSRVRDHQMLEIDRLELNNVLNLENQVVIVFAAMELHGVLINSENWYSVAEEAEANVARISEELDAVVLSEERLSKYVPKYVQTNLFDFEERKLNINWSSPGQKLSIINDLGIELDSTADKELQQVKKQHQIIPKLIDYSKQAKLANAFGKKFLKFINKRTGRIHPTYWQILSTGRISVKEPNVNQIPARGELAKKIRECFIPRPGYKMVGGDFSGMELRIIAEISKDPLWVNAFKDGQDLHSVLCAATFGIDIKDVKKPFPEKPSLTYRDVQKTINFGLAYGMSKHKLAETMQISVDKADEIIQKFFSIVPTVEKTLTTFGELGKARGYIRTCPPFRRIRQFPQYEESISDSPKASKLQGEIERAAKNHPIQGTNGDIIKVALIEAYRVIKDENWPVKILMSVYDELQTECLEEKAEEWKSRLDEIMINAAKIVIKDVPIVVDCCVADYWKK